MDPLKNNPPLGEKLKEIGLIGCGRGAKPQIHNREFKRDEVPLQKKTPSPSLVREGDTGGEVERMSVGERLVGL